MKIRIETIDYALRIWIGIKRGKAVAMGAHEWWSFNLLIGFINNAQSDNQ